MTGKNTVTNPDELRLCTYVDTDAFAAAVGVKPGTLRSALCRDGHYFGVVPCKAASGRLRWPATAVEKLVRPYFEQESGKKGQ
jgi:hypothetical protein